VKVGPAAPLSQLKFDSSFFTFDHHGKRSAAAAKNIREPHRKQGIARLLTSSRFHLHSMPVFACKH